MIAFTVYGKPKSKGSFRPFVNKKSGKVLFARNKSSVDWESMIKIHAQEARTEYCPILEAVVVHVKFFFERPKSSKRPAMTTKPDVDKLIRSLLDGITDILIRDDSQVVSVFATKGYGSPPRMEVELDELDEKSLDKP